MNKQHKNVALIISLIVILGMGIYIVNMKHSYSNKPQVIPPTNDCVSHEFTDFDDMKLVDKFDVSDFSFTETNKIDIPSLQYTNNQISILGSDFKISEPLKEKINKAIKDYGASSSFYIISLDDNLSIGYNVDKRYETASSIKAPYALWIFEEIDKGNIDPNRMLTYTERFYNKGTGIIKKADFNTEYAVKDLLYYSLNDSDNIAHTMLHRTFGVKGYNNMLRNLGTKQLYLTASNPWGFTSPRSAAIIWQEIYNFSIRSDVGIDLLNILSNGKYNYFKEVMPDLPSASKTGFASRDVVETGIVFDKHPYIAIAIANKGGNKGAYTHVLELVNYMNEIMNEYEEYMNNK